MGSEANSSPKSVKQQLQEQAHGIWSSVMADASGAAKEVVPPEAETKKDSSKISFETVIRAMFGSCTVGNAEDADGSIGQQRPAPATEPTSPTRSRGDNLYRQLFSDNRLMAEEAVYHLRQQLEHRKANQSPARQPRGKEVPKVFPASTPRHQLQIEVPSRQFDLPRNVLRSSSTQPLHATSFDDGISVITQITLEELADFASSDSINRVHSDITQDPVESTEESWKETIRPSVAETPSPGRRKGKGMSPPGMAWSSRSQGTMQTRRSHGTKSLGTKSTMSSQTNDFANMLQREEQKYWDEIVKEQEDPQGLSSNRYRKGSKGRKPRRMNEQIPEEQVLKPDETITTVHSTVYSGKSSQQDLSLSATQRDPDRFLEVLIMPPGTEMVEI